MPDHEIDLSAFRDRVEDELTTNILPFWLRHARDPHGGFWGCLDNASRADRNAARGSVLTSRILWTFAAAFRLYQTPAYLQMANAAFATLCNRFWDREQGGLYWSISASNEPLDTRKQIYAQAFGIYGLSEYYRATHDAKALEHAISLHRLIEQHAYDPEHGGYFEARTFRWTPIDENAARTAAKTQNTMMHIMEAYTNLWRAWPDESLRGQAIALVECMQNRIRDQYTGHLIQHFKPDWTPAADVFSYGQDIECSWLVVEAAEALGDSGLIERTQQFAIDLAGMTLEEGMDLDGGLVYEFSPSGVTVSDKQWWAQAEAVVGFLNAFQLTGDCKYLDAAMRVWGFIESRLIDREHGEWFGGVTRDGAVLADFPKIGIGKCPYHNARACMETVRRLSS